MSKRFRECSLDQPYLMAPSLQDWLPEDHLARFIGEVVDTLDLREIYAAYERKDGRGLAAYHPLMLTRVLLYGYCIGVRSSRRIEKATHDEVAFRYLSADQHPDHDTIASFRREHLQALAGLFVQALRLCQQAGLVKLGTVALDGTKILANASGLRSMKYRAMEEVERHLQALVNRLLKDAEQVDTSEDTQFGKGQKEQALPPELSRAQQRLEKLREAKRALEQEAQQRLAEAEFANAKPGPKPPNSGTPAMTEHERNKRKLKRKRARRDAESPSRHYNLTDPDARMMHDNGTKRIVTSYNAQLAVDADHQVIVAAEVTQQVNDRQQLIPMSEAIRQTAGTLPETLLADAGYWDTISIEMASLTPVTLLISPDAGGGQEPRRMLKQPLAQRMREALGHATGRALYRLRKTTVEPVIGRIKETRGFRRFSLRGLQQATAEWKLVCLTHNLLKLHRHHWLVFA
ncbi:MAG: IS1182 family transposase [Acidobacteriota bacterium]